MQENPGILNFSIFEQIILLKMKKISLLFPGALLLLSFASAEQEKNPNTGVQEPAATAHAYWQQHADYAMEVTMDVKNYQ
ncbi:MAG: hypothetical protein KDD04_02725, partial [Sinomicrobium sp.]|nr:hypothetical protein [Sinomicrobium sp.]